MDWGTLVQRRASKEPPDKGGWNMFITGWSGLDMTTPVTNQTLRSNGDKGLVRLAGPAAGAVADRRLGGGAGSACAAEDRR